MQKGRRSGRREVRKRGKGGKEKRGRGGGGGEERNEGNKGKKGKHEMYTPMAEATKSRNTKVTED